MKSSSTIHSKHLIVGEGVEQSESAIAGQSFFLVPLTAKRPVDLQISTGPSNSHVTCVSGPAMNLHANTSAISSAMWSTPLITGREIMHEIAGDQIQRAGGLSKSKN